MQRWSFALVVTLALMPVALSAQEHHARRPVRSNISALRAANFANPAGFVLNHQRQLALTPTQLEKLGRIRDGYRAQNSKAMAAAMQERAAIVKKYGAGPYTAQQRTDILKQMSTRQKDFQQLSRNRRHAMSQIRQVLTPKQRARLQTLEPKTARSGMSWSGSKSSKKKGSSW